MQTLFRNPLAGPFVLGLHSGASLGVALVVLAGGGGLGFLGVFGLLGNLGLVVAASLGAGAVLVLVLFAARRVHTLTLLILGVLLGYAVSAVVTVLLHFSAADRLQAFMVWTFGSFAGVTWSQLRVLVPTLLCATAAAFVVARPLDALLLGEDSARALGVPLVAVRRWCLCCAAVLAGAVTAFCGPIGFLGVAVPHLARGLFATSEHRILLPATALCGALTALLADLVATLPGSSTVLPLNAVTALVGAPCVAWVLLRRPIGSGP
jgi:iron complex transport system permease protein